MVNLLVPGISTLSSSVRHFALYWALAELCGARDYDAATCKTVLRRAEAALAWASLVNPESGELSGPANMHGADTVRRLLGEAGADPLSDGVVSGYSVRTWGYWSQYKGPALTLGIATTDKNALRPGRHPCPRQISDMFRPLLAIATQRSVGFADLGELAPLVSTALDTPDIEPMRALMTAAEDGSHDPGRWVGDDRTRRSTLRIFARAVQLQPGQQNWRARCSGAIAYGGHLDADAVYRQEAERAHAWRGLLLRHRFVGAWRILWAAMVARVLGVAEPQDRAQLHDWIRGETSSAAMHDFIAGLPATVDSAGNPTPAEDVVDQEDRPVIDAALAVLVLGSRRVDELSGHALAAFRGGPSAPRRAYLDPNWVGARAREHEDRRLDEFACAVADDMLDQSHRIALRKLVVRPDGRLEMPSKLHEREGRYFADSTEGAYNIGYREETIGAIAAQLGILTNEGEALEVTDIGRESLALP
jgi:hypothetical protein